LIFLAVVGAGHDAVTPVGADGKAAECDSPALDDCSVTIQLDASATPEDSGSGAIIDAVTITARRRSGLIAALDTEVSRDQSAPTKHEAHQLVQLSIAGLTVAVAAPPVAVTPVNDGIEK
jgi:hypothetical protein